MTEKDSNVQEVKFESDGRSRPWGESHFLRVQNGLKLTLNTQLISTLAFPLAILVAVLCYSNHPGTGKGYGGSCARHHQAQWWRCRSSRAISGASRI